MQRRKNWGSSRLLSSPIGERWLKISELWSLAGLSSTVSQALTAVYMLRAGRSYGFEVDFERALQALEPCAKVLRMFLDELKQYAEGSAPETEAVSILEDAFETADARRILERLSRALRGAEKLADALKRGAFGWGLLDDSDVVELEEVLERLSKALSTRAEKLAGEVFSF